MMTVKRESEKLILFNLLRGFLISLFGMAVLYFLIPFSLISIISDDKLFVIKELCDKNTLICDENRFMFVLIFIFLPMAITFITFRYYYLNKEKAIKIRNEASRKKVFLSNLISSLVLVLLPYMIIWAVTILSPLKNMISYSMINQFFINCIMFEFFVFSVCFIVTVTIRTVVIEFIYVLVFLFIPLLTETVLSNSVELLLKGFVVHLGTFGKILRAFPVSAVIINDFNINIVNSFFYFIFAGVLIILSYNIYVNNVPVKNEGYIRYDRLKGFYRFSFFTFFALVTVIVAKDSLLILLICSFVNLILCELILNGQIKLNKGQKWYFLFITVLTVLFCVFRFDLYNISERPIYIDEVSDIYAGTNYYNIDNLLNISDNEIVYDFENIEHREFVKLDSDKINRFINFHNQIIKEENKEEPLVYLAYKLKNGEIIIRKYRFDYRRLLTGC